MFELLESVFFLIGPFWEKAIAVGAGILALVVALWKIKNSGRKAERAKFEKADREGAKHARKTAEQSLRDSDGVDADELLDRSNGLRDWN